MSLLYARAAIAPVNADVAKAHATDYAKHIYSLIPGFLSNREMVINAQGDTLTIGKVRGQTQLQVRFSTSLPWIDVKQGDVITRLFEKVYVRDVSFYYSLTQSIPLPYAVLYTSYGPLLLSNPADGGFACGAVTITRTMPANECHSILSLAQLMAGAPRDVGEDYIGGPILIKVLQTSPSGLGIRFSTSVAPPGGSQADMRDYFVIDIGETFVLDTRGFVGTMRTFNGQTRLRFQSSVAGAPVDMSLMYNLGSRVTENETAEVAASLGVPGAQVVPE